MANFNGSFTPNFDLAMPDGTDYVDISVLNENMQKIADILDDIYGQLPQPPQSIVNIAEASESVEIPGQGTAYNFTHGLGLVGTQSTVANNYEAIFTEGNSTFVDGVLVIPALEMFPDGNVTASMYNRGDVPGYTLYDGCYMDTQSGQLVEQADTCVLFLLTGSDITQIEFIPVDSTFAIHSYSDAFAGRSVYTDGGYAYGDDSNFTSRYFETGITYTATIYWDGAKEAQTVSLTVGEETIDGYTYKAMHDAGGRFDIIYDGTYYYDSTTQTFKVSHNTGYCSYKIHCVEDDVATPVTINLYTADVQPNT